MPFYTYTDPMESSQDPNLEQPRIKWSWFTLSCIGLFAGFLYLAVVDITGPVQLTQNPAEQQP